MAGTASSVRSAATNPASGNGGARAANIASPRNLINVGVFTALYFIALFASGMLGAIHPIMIFIGGIIGIIVEAIICMLYVARTRAFGAYTILGLIIGILMVATGHAWVTPLVATVLGLAADTITRAGGYARTATNALGFAVFSMWAISPILPVIWASDAYFADIRESMGDTYARDLQSLISMKFLLGWMLVIAFVAGASALLGMKVLRKHFERAGVA